MRLMPRHHGFAQQGLGLVELMVGITIGLIVAAGASVVAVNQITEHRRLMLETQVQQDLRAAADLLQLDMRRAGYRGEAQLGVWAPASGVGTPLEEPAQVATPNSYATIERTDDDRTRALEYRYARGTLGESTGGTELSSNEYFGIRWDKTKKTLYLQLGKKDDQPNWQPITDPGTVEIIDFDIEIFEQQIPLGEFCDRPCTAAGCPQQEVRRVEFMIRGRAKHDAAVTRTLTGAERIRADAMTGACP
jgi:type IV pilus assembly protein PilW